MLFTKRLSHKIMLFSFPAKSIAFIVFTAPVLHHLAHFQPRDNGGRHNFEKNTTAGITLMTYASALTWARSCFE